MSKIIARTKKFVIARKNAFIPEMNKMEWADAFLAERSH